MLSIIFHFNKCCISSLLDFFVFFDLGLFCNRYMFARKVCFLILIDDVVISILCIKIYILLIHFNISIVNCFTFNKVFIPVNKSLAKNVIKKGCLKRKEMLQYNTGIDFIEVVLWQKYKQILKPSYVKILSLVLTSKFHFAFKRNISRPK